MITAEVIYEKTKTLDKATLQEVADFVDFVAKKRNIQKQYDEMRKHFPLGKIEAADQKPEYTTKTLSVEEMDEAIAYEAGQAR